MSSDILTDETVTTVEVLTGDEAITALEQMIAEKQTLPLVNLWLTPANRLIIHADYSIRCYVADVFPTKGNQGGWTLAEMDVNGDAECHGIQHGLGPEHVLLLDAAFWDDEAERTLHPDTIHVATYHGPRNFAAIARPETLPEPVQRFIGFANTKNETTDN